MSNLRDHFLRSKFLAPFCPFSPSTPNCSLAAFGPRQLTQGTFSIFSNLSETLFSCWIILTCRLDGPRIAFSGSLCLVIMLTTTQLTHLLLFLHQVPKPPTKDGDKYAVEQTLRHILAIVLN